MELLFDLVLQINLQIASLARARWDIVRVVVKLTVYLGGDE